MIDAAVHGQERDALLNRIITGLEADTSIVAAWLAGSIGRGMADDLSDLDLWIVVADDRIQEIATDPVAFVHAIAPTIMEIQAPSNAPPGGAYLLTWISGAAGPQQVDWYWQPVTDAVRPARSRLVFEGQPIPLEPGRERLPPEELDRALKSAVEDCLLMAFIAAKHARRGNPWTTTGQMMHLADCIGIVEWLLERGTSPDFDDRARTPLPHTIPITREDQLAWIAESLQRLTALLDGQHSTMLSSLKTAFRSVERWLEAGPIRNRLPHPDPAGTPRGDPPTPPGD